jgi:hypothetical protein
MSTSLERFDDGELLVVCTRGVDRALRGCSAKDLAELPFGKPLAPA